MEHVRSLVEAPSPAVLTTYRRDGSANVSPVWFRWHEAAFEVVIAEGDVKLRHLARDPRCVLEAARRSPTRSLGAQGLGPRGDPAYGHANRAVAFVA